MTLGHNSTTAAHEWRPVRARIRRPMLAVPGAYPPFVVRRGPAWRGWRVPGWLRRLAELGAVPSDSEELRLRKAVLTLSSTMMASLACAGVATYAGLRAGGPAASPLCAPVARAPRPVVLARPARS